MGESSGNGVRLRVPVGGAALPRDDGLTGMTAETSSAQKSARPRKVRLGDLLMEHGVITKDQLEAALSTQKKTGRKLGRELIESGFITEDTLADFLSKQLGIPFVDLKQFPLSPEAVRLVPETYARRYRVLGLSDTPDGLMIGMADPTDIFAYDELARLVDRPLLLAVVKEGDLLQILDRHFRRTAEITGLAQEVGTGFGPSVGEVAAQTAAAATDDAPVVKFLQTMIEDALQVGASDIHIEPEEKELRIRLRQDGVLHVQTSADARVAAPLLSRLKLMAGMDISEKRMPQDGRFHFKAKGRAVDVRLSTVPVQYGESAVMRILNQNSGLLGLDKIGMPSKMLERFRRLIHSPNGVVLVTGPTGSGKTTTLYSALTDINSPEVKILTVEDPVEYRLPGICQVQVNPKIELSFARVLRTFLRQDPDVILVGEMRDQETVEIGLRAAITGHFVLSSLHTNDAVSTAVRLVDMGAEPYLIAAALRGIVAQRLVRRVCESCIEPHALDERERALVETSLGSLGKAAAQLPYKRGRGCNYCNHTGYHGRVAVYELLEIDAELVHVLQQGDMSEFAQAARRSPSYQSLRKSALALAAAGHTSIEQVIRIVHGVDG